jgi:hypothetical protein
MLKRLFSKVHFGVDKTYIRCIVESTIRTKLSLSKGGDGWSKTFRSIGPGSK